MLARTWEKANLVTLLAGIYFGAATVENRKGITKKIKIELPYDPAIPLLGVYQTINKPLVQKDKCTPMFTAALFITAKV